MGKKEEQRNDQTNLDLAWRRIAGRRLIAAKAWYSGEAEDLRQESIENGAPRWRILRYKRVVNPDDLPLPVTLDSFVTPKTFEKHLKFLTSHCHPVSLPELIRKIDNYEDIPDKTVALTFDCGYMDTYLYAFPLLLKYQVPATFFFPTAFIESGSFLFEDLISLALTRIELSGGSIPVISQMGRDVYEVIGKTSPELKINDQTIMYFIQGLRRLSEVERSEVLKQVGEMASQLGPPPEFEDFLRWDDVSHLVQLGMTVGMMGHGYVLTPCVEPDVFLGDFGAGYNALREHGIEPVRVYCFPEGLYTEESWSLLEGLRMRYALAIGDLPEPRFQTRLPMIFGRITMNEITASTRPLFACRLWNLKVSGIQY